MPIIKQTIKEQHRGKVLWVIQKQYVTIPLSGIYNLDSRIQTTHTNNNNNNKTNSSGKRINESAF